jgi:hypothetical protein
MPDRQRFSTAILSLLVCIAAQLVLRGDDEPTAGCPCPYCERCSRCGQWYVVESDNFQVCCLDSQATAKLLTKEAETLRTKLHAKWLGDGSPARWDPKCQIVLHPNLDSYVNASGRGSEHTVGSSLVGMDKGRIRSRRIDLLGGREDFLTAALPHELTHVVLKDRFGSKNLPRWADEGAAILADTEAKQARHRRDFEEAISRGVAFDAATLVTMENYPSPQRVATFYGQSAALAAFLIDQGKPADFIKFVESASAKGYDSALRDCYGIADVRDLDRLWQKRAYLAIDDKSAYRSTVRAAR